jgi:hypothetical protein
MPKQIIQKEEMKMPSLEEIEEKIMEMNFLNKRSMQECQLLQEYMIILDENKEKFGGE